MLLWPFNKYPGTDYETFNWEWILKTVKDWVAKMTEFVRDMTNEWDTFRNYINHEIAEMHRKFAIYVNVTEEALNTGSIADGAVTFEKLNDSVKTYVTPDMFDSVAEMYLYAYNHNLEVVIPEDTTATGSVTISANTIGINGAKLTANNFTLGADVTLKDLTLVSDMQPSGNDEDVLLGIYGADAIIENCNFIFTNDNGKALAIKGSSNSTITITGSTFNKCSTNFSGCKFVKIDNCMFDMDYTNTDHECVQFTINTSGIISNNHFYHSKNDFIDLFSAGSDCVITGNTFDGCHSHNMIEAKTTIRDNDFGSSDTNGWCRRNIISNNHFKNLIAQSGGVYSFIGIFAVKDANITDDDSYYPGDTIVSGNIIEGCQAIVSSGAYFFGVTVCAKNVTVTDNQIDITEPFSTGRSACIFTGEHGANSTSFWNTTSSIILANNILGGNAYAIWIRNSHTVTIANNVERKPHNLKRFITMDGSNDDITVENNTANIGSNTSFIFLNCADAASNMVVSGNITDAAITSTGTLNKCTVHNNLLLAGNACIYINQATTTSCIISDNFLGSSNYAIFFTGSTIFNVLVSNNACSGGSIVRVLNPATETNPVLLGNIVANAENNTIRTT